MRKIITLNIFIIKSRKSKFSNQDILEEESKGKNAKERLLESNGLERKVKN
jgi:hypothetical protein